MMAHARLPSLEGAHPAWRDFFGAHEGLREASEALPDAPPKARFFELLLHSDPDGVLVLVLGGGFGRSAAGSPALAPPARAPGEKAGGPGGSEKGPKGAGKGRPAQAAPRKEGLRRLGADLLHWAAQGALPLLFGGEDGGPGGLGAPWAPFAARFVQALAARATAAGRPLICLPRGPEEAALCAGVEGGGHLVLRPARGGPADARLQAANQALELRGLRPIEWEPLAPTLAFTDGSCVRNGRPDAEAGYAVHYWAGPLRGVELRGRVAPCEYAFVDPSEPRLGFVPSAGAPATPTNNRGEYLAWCWCLLLLLRAGGRGAAEVVSDCNLFIRTMEEWLPARRARGTERELKNYDLVAVGAALLAALRGQIGLGPRGVELTHIRSHRKRPSAASGRRAQILWAGNDRADRGAKQALGPALKDPAAPLLITHSPALHWALWGRWGGTGRPGALAPEREA